MHQNSSFSSNISLKMFSSSPHYRLYYFNFAGRTEPIRQLLHFVGQPFENVTLKPKEWVTGMEKFKKTDCKYGQMPILEIDEQIQLAQCHTILRYLREKFGLMPKNELEKAMADELNELNRDFVKAILPYLDAYCGWTTGDLKKLRQEVFITSLQRFIPHFENALLLAANSTMPSGFFLPSGICYVDFMVASVGNFVEWAEPECFHQFPKFSAYLARMRALPQLKEHYANLPLNYHTPAPGMPFNRPA